MNSSASNPNALAKTLTVALVVFVIGVLGMNSSQTSTSAAAQEERVFENKIPSHIPIKIKIKKEKEQSFKDLKNEKWLSEFEIEVTNTGDRPIYFLYITFDTDVRVGGQRLVFPISYGRAELSDIVSKAQTDDVPIKPGETHVFQMGEVPAWERGVREERFPQATRFGAELQSLSFGDGTGYFGTEIYPPANKKQSPPEENEQAQKVRPKTLERSRARPDPPRKIFLAFLKPTFLSANFLSSDTPAKTYARVKLNRRTQRKEVTLLSA